MKHQTITGHTVEHAVEIPGCVADWPVHYQHRMDFTEKRVTEDCDSF